MEFEELPLDIQRDVKRREAVTRPLYEAISALDVSWEIVRGNMEELDRVLDVFEGDEWLKVREPPAEYQYHREVLRLFHNFLSASTAAVWHAERIVGRVKHLAPEVSVGYRERVSSVRNSREYRFLVRVRNYGVHSGHHISVLHHQGAKAASGDMTLIRSVRFSVDPVRAELEQQLRRGRSRKGRIQLRAELEFAAALPSDAPMRDLLLAYFDQVGTLFGWLRQALVAFSASQNAKPIEAWMGPEQSC